MTNFINIIFVLIYLSGVAIYLYNYYNIYDSENTIDTLDKVKKLKYGSDNKIYINTYNAGCYGNTIFQTLNLISSILLAAVENGAKEAANLLPFVNMKKGKVGSIINNKTFWALTNCAKSELVTNNAGDLELFLVKASTNINGDVRYIKSDIDNYVRDGDLVQICYQSNGNTIQPVFENKNWVVRVNQTFSEPKNGFVWNNSVVYFEDHENSEVYLKACCTDCNWLRQFLYNLLSIDFKTTECNDEEKKFGKKCYNPCQNELYSCYNFKDSKKPCISSTTSCAELVNQAQTDFFNVKGSTISNILADLNIFNSDTENMLKPTVDAAIEIISASECCTPDSISWLLKNIDPDELYVSKRNDMYDKVSSTTTLNTETDNFTSCSP